MTPEKLEYSRKWRQANPDKVKASRKRWRDKNPDKVSVINKRYNAKHKQRLAQKQKAVEAMERVLNDIKNTH